MDNHFYPGNYHRPCWTLFSFQMTLDISLDNIMKSSKQTILLENNLLESELKPLTTLNYLCELLLINILPKPERGWYFYNLV